jgi:hypothetical protein
MPLVQMKVVYESLILIVLCTKCLSIEGATFLVSDYGAYPNDNIDDTIAIQTAVDAAINHRLKSTISFGYGTYNLSATIVIINATNLTITGQGMDQTLLVGNIPMSLFFAQYCNGLTICSLSIDFDPLPFTAGYIVNVNDTYLDVQVQPPHHTDINRQVLGIHRFDPVEMRPAFGPNTYEIYQVPPKNVSTTIVSPDVIRIPMSVITKFGLGEAVVVIYGPRHDAIFAHDLTELNIQSIGLYTSWYMGIRTTRVKHLNIVNYYVKPHNGHWLSINADCMHFADSREYIRISDSKCQMQGDDGLHVHGQYFIVTEVINSSALILQAFNNTDPLNIGDRTHLEFSTNKQPFTPVDTGTVASSILDSPTSRLFIFTGPINASINDYACVADTPSVIIRNFTVERNRGRGVLFETRNIDIRQSIFNQTSAPAVLFQPSLYWHDGPASRNITLTENLYISCNEGIGQKKGMITVFPFPVQLVPVIEDIRIESSTFLFGNYSQGIIQSANADNLYLTGNYIATNSSTPLISICNSRNITASNNTVVDTQSKIDQYYILDQTSPCHTNLSSLIDLPPSAFNSSFSPPVSFTSERV